MSEREAFIRAICDEPADDVRRLVYADWLDEHGERERAEFIRWHLNHRPPGFRPFDTEPNLEWHPPMSKHSRREKTDRVEYLNGDGVAMALVYSRGFVSRIEMSCAYFMKHAKSLFMTHPVTEVRLMDKEPSRDSPTAGDGPTGMWCFDGKQWTIKSETWVLPLALWKYCAAGAPRRGNESLYHSQHYASIEDATQDARQCLVAYGRKLAGLPVLDRAATVK